MKIHLLILIIISSLCNISCNKTDDSDDGCIMAENFFSAQFDGQIIKPHYAQGGGFGLYTLYLERCLDGNNNFLIKVTTAEAPYFYLNLINISDIGNYPINSGNNSHLSIDCDVETSIYLDAFDSVEHIFISNNMGQVEITQFDSNLGIIVGTFTSEMVSTEDPSIVKTIRGEFNLNKSTLNNRERPCWLRD